MRCLAQKIVASSQPQQQKPKASPVSRRETLLGATTVPILGAILSIGAAPRPSNLGLKDYGSFKQLGLCPPTPNCISTAEEANDESHYVPPLAYNANRKGGKISKKEAMDEVVKAIETTPIEKFDKFSHKLIKRTDNYLYYEFQSPLLGFIDDVEFYFPDNGKDIMEYRSSSRVGESDFDINRKRIRSVRKALEPAGWKSVGF